MVWSVGAALGLGRMLLACGAIWRMRRAARALAIRDISTLTHSLGLHGEIDVLEMAWVRLCVDCSGRLLKTRRIDLPVFGESENLVTLFGDVRP